MHPGSGRRRAAGRRAAGHRRSSRGRSGGGRSCRSSGRCRCSSPITLVRTFGITHSGIACRRTAVVATAKIGHIPARALELKTCCRQLLGERGTATRGAHGQGVGRHFLQYIPGVAAGTAFVGIDRHGRCRGVIDQGANAKPSIIGSRPEIKASGLACAPCMQRFRLQCLGSAAPVPGGRPCTAAPTTTPSPCRPCRPGRPAHQQAAAEKYPTAQGPYRTPAMHPTPAPRRKSRSAWWPASITGQTPRA